MSKQELALIKHALLDGATLLKMYHPNLKAWHTIQDEALKLVTLEMLRTPNE